MMLIPAPVDSLRFLLPDKNHVRMRQASMDRLTKLEPFMTQFPPDPAMEAQYRVAESLTPEELQSGLERYAMLSEEARRHCLVYEDLVFDARSGCSLDLFPAREGAPLLLFIHGGYWRMFSRRESAFMARPFVERGIAVATLDYQLAPAVTLDEIVRQVGAAGDWLMRGGPRYGVAADAIWVSGSSAGGHLAAMVCATDWPSGGRFRGLMPISGLFDLRPISHTFINEWLRLDDRAAERLSPLLIPPPECPVHIFWGELEPDVFKRQSINYADYLRDRGVSVSMTEIAGRNHFDVALELSDPASSLARRFLDIMLADDAPPTSSVRGS